MAMLATIGTTSALPLFSETHLAQASVVDPDIDRNQQKLDYQPIQYFYSIDADGRNTYVYKDTNLSTRLGSLTNETQKGTNAIGVDGRYGSFAYKAEPTENKSVVKLSILKPGTKTLKTLGYMSRNVLKNSDEITTYLTTDDNVKMKDVNGNEFVNKGWKQKTVVTIMKKGFPIYRGTDLSEQPQWGNGGSTSTNMNYHNTFYVTNHMKNQLDPSETYSMLVRSKDGGIGYVNDKALSDITGTEKKGMYYKVDKTMEVKQTDFDFFKNLGSELKGANPNYEKKGGNTTSWKGKKVYIARAYTHVDRPLDSTWDGFKGKDYDTRLVYYSVYDKKDGKWLGYVHQDAFKDGMHKVKKYSPETYVSIAKPDYDIWTEENFKSKIGKAKEGEWFRAGEEYKHSNGSTYVELLTVDKYGMGTSHGFINKNALKFEDNNFGPYKSFKKNVKIMKNGYGVYKDKNFKNKVNTSDKLKGKVFYAKGCYDRFKSPTDYQDGNYNEYDDGLGHVFENNNLSNLNGEHGGRYYSLYDNKGNWQGYINANACQIVK